ncbi:MAG TPA: ATP-binding protein [Candidatus Binatia bacterium]|nr:ATP-binding protein [Candidatus Binatia bacterium]
MQFRNLPIIRFFAGRQRGRLMRDYFLISVLLVGSGLVTSGAIEIYYRYLESQETLALLQREVAAGAAFKIENFVQDIHSTLRGATRSREIAPKGLTNDFRFELEKLLLIAPSVTEAIALNQDGGIQVQASRLRTVLPDVKRDFATAPPFVHARKGQSYFGPVYFVRGSEPYMTIAVPIERFAGDVIGVLQAEVNLKYIGDVVSNLKIGQAGYSYVISRSGELIAHPDISLVLQRRNVLNLESTKAAFTPAAERPKRQALVTPNVQGKRVLTASAQVNGLDWAVVVDRPVEEAYEPLYASVFRTSTVLLFGLGLALMASLFIGRRAVRPVGILREGVERIGKGDLSHRLDLKTGDEIEVLADEFNKMTTQLQESYANLEQKVEDRTKELTESLEQQTATSQILGVIASSPTDIQPVLDVVAERAAALCDAADAVIISVESGRLRAAAHYGEIPFLAEGETMALDRDTLNGRCFVDRKTIHVNDLAADPEFPVGSALAQRFGFHTALATPLLREHLPIGTISIRRTEVRPFTDKQISLLKTFANQAVIAIENVRLFQELETRNREVTESLEQQTATSEILGVIASSPTDIQPVLDVVAERAARLCDASDAQILRINGDMIRCVAGFGSLPAVRDTPLQRTWPGSRAIIDRETIHIDDLAAVVDTEYPDVKSFQQQWGHRTVLATPLLREGVPIGAILIRRMEVRPFTEKQIALLRTFADQAVIAIENVRLFKELGEKNDQLEAANKHKSQFLANVSHELRTPLNSIIGFTRIVLRRTEGKIEQLQKDNLQKVLISSEHLLSLINELLDLAKIEAGRMEVYAENFKLEEVVRIATATVEPMLKNGNVKLISELPADLPPLKSDRDKLKQIVLNLLSNSAKFTEKGEIKVAAVRDNGTLKLTVSDTGIGMSQQALKYIFDEFRQVDMSTTRKYGGTGLGLAIVKRLSNLLGGDIEVTSEEGKGSQFTVTIPMELKIHAQDVRS